MSSTTLDYALDVVMQLSLEQREMLIDIVRRRDIEGRRQEIAREAREALEALRRGELKPMSVEEMIQELHAESDADE